MPKRKASNPALEFYGASDATLRLRVQNMISAWVPKSPLSEDWTFQQLKAHVAELERRSESDRILNKSS